MTPTPVTKKQWIQAHRNFNKIGYDPLTTNVDVVFLGQGVVEAMDGKHFGTDLSKTDDYFGHVQHMFNNRFQAPDATKNHDLYGVTMGIAGDQANNILWRLMHGELNEDFNPPFWWIVTGMEDLARYRCSEEIVIMGVLRIVEEIKKFKPDAKIIINGLFPMIKLRSADEPTENDFIDAKRAGDNNMSDRIRNRNRALQGGREETLEFKSNLAKRLQSRYSVLVESQKEKEKELQLQLKAVWKDESKSREEKKEMAISIRESLQQLKDHHEKAQKSLQSYIKDLKKDQFNPVVEEKHTYRKDNLFHHRSNGGVPIWSATHEINKQLHEFASRTPKVTFYDPTPIFADVNGRKAMLKTELISPRGHPTQSGYKMWLSEIQRMLIEWKKELKQEQEEKEALALKDKIENGGLDDDDSQGDDFFAVYGYEFDDDDGQVATPFFHDEKKGDEDDDIDMVDDFYYVQDDWV